jgi:hypothetical protein
LIAQCPYCRFLHYLMPPDQVTDLKTQGQEQTHQYKTEQRKRK